MITCDDIDVILAVGAASGGLSADEDETVRAHTASCARCRRAAAEYTATADMLAIAVEQVPPPERLRGRIMSQVYASTSAATAGRPAGARTGLLARLWRAVPAGRGLTLGGAAAALAAVGLLVWAAGPGRGGGTPAPESVAVRSTVIGSPLQGSLTWYPSTQTSVLSVHGLGQQPGRVYEVWLVRPSNAVTAAGYLTEQPDGSWTAAIRGSIAGYSSVAATSEPDGGSPTGTPTTQPVLTGMLPSS